MWLFILLIFLLFIGYTIDRYKSYKRRKDLQVFIDFCDEVIAVENIKKAIEKKQVEEVKEWLIR